MVMFTSVTDKSQQLFEELSLFHVTLLFQIITLPSGLKLISGIESREVGIESRELQMIADQQQCTLHY